MTERERAAFGPRALKKPGSVEWCWQTLDGLKRYYESIDERFHDVEKRVMELAEFEAWKVVPPSKPYGSLDAMLKAEIGVSERKLVGDVASRKARNQAINAKAPDLKPARRPTKAEKADNNKNDVRVFGNSAEYAIAKLRQDAPVIHARVLAGELTAHAGMVEAGFRKRRAGPRKKRLKRCPSCGHEW